MQINEAQKKVHEWINTYGGDTLIFLQILQY